MSCVSFLLPGSPRSVPSPRASQMRPGPDAGLGAVFIIYRSEGDLCESRSASDRLLLRRWSALPRSGPWLCLSRIVRVSTHHPLSSGSEHPPAQLDSWPLSQFSRCLSLETELAVQSVVCYEADWRNAANIGQECRVWADTRWF